MSDPTPPTRRERAASKRQDESDTRQDISDTRTQTLEERLDNVVAVVGQYQNTAEEAIHEIRRERYWRRTAVVVIGAGTIFVLVITIMLLFQGQRITRTIVSTNDISNSTSRALEILQRQQREAEEQDARTTAIVEDALRRITEQDAAQIDQLRQDLQNILRMLQRGVPIPEVPAGPSTTVAAAAPATRAPPTTNPAASGPSTTTTTVPTGLVCSVPILGAIIC
jgi:hypothetical protein